MSFNRKIVDFCIDYSDLGSFKINVYKLYINQNKKIKYTNLIFDI